MAARGSGGALEDVSVDVVWKRRPFLQARIAGRGHCDRAMQMAIRLDGVDNEAMLVFWLAIKSPRASGKYGGSRIP